MTDVARGIRQIIREKGLKQYHVAEKARFSTQQITDMLAGRKVIRAEYLPAIAEALEVTIQDIFDASER